MNPPSRRLIHSILSKPATLDIAEPALEGWLLFGADRIEPDAAGRPTLAVAAHADAHDDVEYRIRQIRDIVHEIEPGLGAAEILAYTGEILRRDGFRTRLLHTIAID